MTLISPKFLQMCQLKKAKILKALFEDDDIFSIVMAQKEISFEECCNWIADEVFDIDLPQASQSEVQIIRLAAKEMTQQMNDQDDDD